MLYEEARVYLDHVSKYGSVLGLDSIKSLLGELGNPQKDLKFIHIAGTNGKGSILAGLSGILQQAGYRTGRYCSPTVMGYMERFQVDGQWMAEDELAPFVSQVKEATEKVEEKTDLTVTVFEIETAIAFLYFREKQCDYVVLEAGMGGLLDATNVIDTTVLSIFASISMDHIGVLGNTLEEIAENKAGIIKPSCLAVVTSPQQMSVTDILQKKAGECGCRFVVSHPEKAVISEVKQLFRPEFLNRIDEIIVFHPLNEDNMKKIVGLMCKEVVQRAKEQLEIILVVRDSVKKHIVETGSDKKYGARPLRRAVQSQLEDKLAEALLNGEIKRGDHVEAGISKKEIKFTVRERRSFII